MGVMDIRCWKCNLIDDNCSLVELEVADGLHSFDAITMVSPGGAYTTFRTYDHHKALRLRDHLERLKLTTQLAGKPLSIDQNLIRMYLRQIVDQFPKNLELRIRIVLDLFEKPWEIYFMSEHLRTPGREEYQNGVKLITCTLQRANPKAKLTQSIPRAEEIRAGLSEDVHEALMVDDDGYILEGLTCNFFAVKGGELWTNEESVLSGITRSLVLDEAVRIELPVNFRSITITEVPILEEAFITSSSRGILPVKQIDEVLIGYVKPVSLNKPVCPGQSVCPGQPGPITRRLMVCLEDRIRKEVLEI